jgi:hypothetical protein
MSHQLECNGRSAVVSDKFRDVWVEIEAELPPIHIGCEGKRRLKTLLADATHSLTRRLATHDSVGVKQTASIEMFTYNDARINLSVATNCVIRGVEIATASNDRTESYLKSQLQQIGEQLCDLYDPESRLCWTFERAALRGHGQTEVDDTVYDRLIAELQKDPLSVDDVLFGVLLGNKYAGRIYIDAQEATADERAALAEFGLPVAA